MLCFRIVKVCGHFTVRVDQRSVRVDQVVTRGSAKPRTRLQKDPRVRTDPVFRIDAIQPSGLTCEKWLETPENRPKTQIGPEARVMLHNSATADTVL